MNVGIDPSKVIITKLKIDKDRRWVAGPALVLPVFGSLPPAVFLREPMRWYRGIGKGLIMWGRQSRVRGNEREGMERVGVMTLAASDAAAELQLRDGSKRAVIFRGLPDGGVFGLAHHAGLSLRGRRAPSPLRRVRASSRRLRSRPCRAWTKHLIQRCLDAALINRSCCVLAGACKQGAEGFVHQLPHGPGIGRPPPPPSFPPS